MNYIDYRKMHKKYKYLLIDLDGTIINTISGSIFPKGIWDMKFDFNVLIAIKNCEFVSDWKHFFSLRSSHAGATGMHPDMDYIANKIYDEFLKRKYIN